MSFDPKGFLEWKSALRYFDAGSVPPTIALSVILFYVISPKWWWAQLTDHVGISFNSSEWHMCVYTYM